MFFEKRTINDQAYIYRVEYVGKGKKVRSYLGNLRDLEGDVLDEVNTYFERKQNKKEFKQTGNYTTFFESDMVIENFKFGDMWLVAQIEKMVNLVSIVDSVLNKRKRVRLATTGLFFLIASINRLLDPNSKNKMVDWLKSYALDHIFNIDDKIDPTQFTSDAYWHQWNSITENQLKTISDIFLAKCCEIAGVSSSSSASSFDTTNYYLFMASETASKLAKRGKNKQRRDDLRQFGLAALADNDTEMIMHYNVFEGSTHDSKVLNENLGEMIDQARKCGKDNLLFIFDNGNNSEENFKYIDEKEGVNFITSYSPNNITYLMLIKLDKYKIVDCKYNNEIDQEISKNTKNADILNKKKILAYTTFQELWGKIRKVVVVYNPDNAKKQKIHNEENIEKLRNWIIEAKVKVKENAIGYTTKQSVVNLYKKQARKCHISSDIFELSFNEENGLKLNFRKNNSCLNELERKYGKLVIISGNIKLPTEKIVQLYFDRYVIEKIFRQTKDSDCCSVWPVYHRTDFKIRCHVFCAIVAYSYYRLIELKLRKLIPLKTGKYFIDKMSGVLMNRINYVALNMRNREIYKLSKLDSEQKSIISEFNCDISDNNIVIK